ncbi:hypothetical protein HPY86_00100 [candidate division WOR-3 bacterium]|nr:hypothetical protein [candidate division WOR-3 bacterium]
MNLATISNKRLLFGIVALFLGCSPKFVGPPIDPERVDKDIWKSLNRLNSFRFSLYYYTDWPTNISARFSGGYNSPDKEKWDGYLEREEYRKMVRIRARDDWQFVQEGKGWFKMPRGVESRIFDQIEHVLHNAQLEFIGLEKGRYRYRFKPNLPLLDLPGLKQIVGVLEIDAKSGLPLRIYCYAEDKSAVWDMRFERFNRTGRIKFPFVPAVSVILDAAAAKGIFKINRAKSIIRNRLKFLGVESQIKSLDFLSCDKFEVLIDRNFSNPTLRLLFGMGRVEVWDAVWADSLDFSGKSLPVAGDASKRVVLKTLLASNQQLKAEPVLDLPVGARLKTTVLAGQSKSKGLTVLVLDGAVLGIGVWEDAEMCSFADIGGDEIVRVVAALASQEPLPFGFQVNVRNN